MSTWQFQGTVSYQSGDKVAFAGVSLARANGRSSSPAVLLHTDTDLTGRFDATLRDGPPGGPLVARAYDGWNKKFGEWTSVASDGKCDLSLTWKGPQIAKVDRLDFFESEPFIRALLFALELPGAGRTVFTIRRQPLREDGHVHSHYPGDPAVERMFSQFQEECSQCGSDRRAAETMARRITDCLMRMGQSPPYPERIGVIRAVLLGMIARTPSEKRTNARNLLKALSAASRRPFVPGNGALVDFEPAAASIAMVLYAVGLLSLGRADLRIERWSTDTGEVRFQVDVPKIES